MTDKSQNFNKPDLGIETPSASASARSLGIDCQNFNKPDLKGRN